MAKKNRSGNPALRSAQGNVRSHSLDLTWENAVTTPAYQLLAKVYDDRRKLHDFWIVLGLEHGFVGIEVGKESEANMHALPGISWSDVVSVGTAQDPGEFSPTTLAFEQLTTLWSNHEGHELGEVHEH